MNDKMNKASICSIISLDIIDFSVKSEAEKLEVKNQFDNIVNHALADIPEDDRVVVDAVNGVAIVCSGLRENALEDALFISLTIRDEILKNNIHSVTPLYVQLGINMGSVQMTDDVDGRPSLVGDGLDNAQRVMCFANPNQILVSNAYYESASKLTHEISQMFEKYDMHTLEHDVYAVRLLKDMIIEETPSIPADISDQASSVANKINWKYIASVSLGLLVFFVITKAGLEPSEPTIILDAPIVATTVAQPKNEPTSELPPTIQTAQVEPASKDGSELTAAQEDVVSAEPLNAVKTITEVKKTEDSPKKAKVQNKIAQKVDADAKSTSSNSSKSEANQTARVVLTNPANKTPTNSTVGEQASSTPTKHAEVKAEKSIAKEKSGWESFKEGLAKGAERKCTQGEIAMNQCAK